jgi:hypothetical protein
MASITAQNLEQASKEEENNTPITDPAVRLLKSQVYATIGCVQGSDHS